MSLTRQLLIWLLLLLLLGLSGGLAISARNSWQGLEEQLAVHAREVATSLGLSISLPLSENDHAAVASAVDASCDQGRYRLIRIENVDGSIIVERKLPLEAEQFHAWFFEQLTLQAPAAMAAVMSDRQQTGVVRVSIHPGIAYARLWGHISDMFRWFLLNALLVILLGALSLRWLLQPLRAIESQADAICQRHLPVLEPLPKTRELRAIVVAINGLSSRVRTLIKESEQLAAGLRSQAYQHPVTGLSNRRI